MPLEIKELIVKGTVESDNTMAVHLGWGCHVKRKYKGQLSTSTSI